MLFLTTDAVQKLWGTIKGLSKNVQFRVLGWCKRDKDRAKSQHNPSLSFNLPSTPANLQTCFIG